MEAAFIFLLCFAIYFAPSFIGNHKRNAGAIWVLNIFLGWTLIGWVVALVWACTAETPVQYTNFYEGSNVPKKGTKADELEKLKTLHDRGVLTDDEFNVQKERVLKQSTNL
ncbi:MAG TPA: superinfection immunity protein [Chryseosolibacter sp.]